MEVGHCWPRKIESHSLDVLYGHFHFKPDEVARLMRGKFLLFIVVRDPWQVSRSAFIHRRQQDADAFIGYKMLDEVAPMMSGISWANKYYDASSADPGCTLMWDAIRRYDIVAPYEHMEEMLALLYMWLPATFGPIESRELCVPVAHTLCSSNPRCVAFDAAVGQEAQARWARRLTCHTQLWNFSKAQWNATKAQWNTTKSVRAPASLC